MKSFKTIIILFFLFFYQINYAQFSTKKITIKGKIQFLNPVENMQKFNGYNINKVYFKHKNAANIELYDSTEINKDGSWIYNLTIDTPTFYDINIAKWHTITVWADDNIEINARGYDTAKMKIKNPPYLYIYGSKENIFLNLINHAYYRHFQNIISTSSEIYFSENPLNKEWNDYLIKNNIFNNLYDDFNERILIFIEAFKDNPIVIYAYNFLNTKSKETVMLPIINNLVVQYPWFYYAKNLLKTIALNNAKAATLKPNMPAPKIHFLESNNKEITLDFYKGKYVLIDFWASWCGPCRKSIPELINLYETYHSAGFEILSVSIDENEADWKKAVLEEEMPWKQVRSSNINETLQQFNFSGIPTLYLIDPDGNIVTSFTGFTNDINIKLKSIFKKN